MNAINLNLFGYFFILGTAMYCNSVAAFARRKRRKAAGGKRKQRFPPVPPCSPGQVGEAAASGAAPVAEGFFEFPLSAEETLCKVAASSPLRPSCGRWGLDGVALSYVPALATLEAAKRLPPGGSWHRRKAMTEGDCASCCTYHLHREC